MRKGGWRHAIRKGNEKWARADLAKTRRRDQRKTSFAVSGVSCPDSKKPRCCKKVSHSPMDMAPSSRSVSVRSCETSA